MGPGVNIITTDEYVTAMGTGMQERCLNLNEWIRTYVSLLDSAATAGFVSGETADAIAAFADVARGLKEYFESLGNSIELSSGNFNKKIDKADQYLY